MAGFFLYKRYKRKHAELKLAHDKLSDLREIKGNANEGFIELHEPGAGSPGAGSPSPKEDANTNDAQVVDNEEPRKKKVRPTVTFGGTVTIGEDDDGADGRNLSGLFSSESAIY